MIPRTDILERAREWQLLPEVVEKDYVLGWVLSGIALHDATKDAWVFKGGTCLKKCVIETYRFSEDLDFSLLPSAEYTEAGIRATLLTITARVADLSGIRFPAEVLGVKRRGDKLGRTTFEASIGYAGPLAMPGPPKVRLDLTQHEPVLLPVERRVILHPYPDSLPAEAAVATYATPELIAEKTRALWERMRPRDLYDVVLLAPATPAPNDATALRRVARQKFAGKSLPLPTAFAIADRASRDEGLRADWANMLGHQLPATPDLDDFLVRLPDALAWIDEPAAAAAPARRVARPSVPGAAGEIVVRPRGVQVWRAGAPLEAIRFAGASHLLVSFRYHGASRVVEPYSLRRPRTGNLLLYGFERRKNGALTDDIRAYNVAEMGNVQVLSDSFKPRYAIELIEQPGVWRW